MAISFLAYFWIAVQDFFNSPFVTSVIVSIIGAGIATAIGAQTAEKTSIARKEQEDMANELRSLNVAITLTSSITNTFFAVKKQFVADFVKEYDEGREKFVAQLEQNKYRRSKEQIVVFANFLSYEFPQVPLSMLEKIILEKISIRTRPLAAFVELSRAYDNATGACQMREAMLKEFKSGYSPYVLYGIKEDSVTDQRYLNLVHGLGKYTEDGIFFGHQLGKDLEKYAHELALEFSKKYRGEKPIITTTNYNDAIGLGLMPLIDAEYQNWLDSFVTPPPKVPLLKRVSLRFKLYANFVTPFQVQWMAIDALFLSAAIVGVLWV